MSKRILIDAAHPEEVRVALVDQNNRLEELDIETATKENLKGNIYLAKVTRVEPSLQAAFVEYGGNRHGFLPFSEIHPDYFQISPEQRQAIEAEIQSIKEARTGKRNASRSETVHGSTPIDSVIDGVDERQSEAEQLEVDLQTAGFADLADSSDAEEDLPEVGSKDDIITGTVKDDLKAPKFVTVTDDNTAQQKVVKIGGDVPPEIDEEEEGRVPAFANHFQIQDVIRNNQIMLVQIAKEERGTKGAALTTYLTLAGRYCVLMPNTTGSGGVSRKITSSSDRRRLKEIIDEFNLPESMSLIIRTAGADRSKEEIKGDARYLCRLWERVRERTLSSVAPTLIYDEPNLIQRSIRDLFSRDVDKVIVEGAEAYEIAKSFINDLMPNQNNRLSLFRNQGTPLLQYFGVEDQIDEMRLPQVYLPSGGSIVINQTEALVAIDINSGKSTKSQHIKETAFRTNFEAAEEIARQLRLRDLAGLIVIDFIDMDDPNHIRQIENRMREVMSQDRARVQIGQISTFGLLEMSRQRMRPSIIESSYIQCAHCKGTGVVRSTSASAIEVLRAISDEAGHFTGDVMSVMTPREVGYYLLNYKRDKLYEIEQRYSKMILIKIKSTLIAPEFEFEHVPSRVQQGGVRLQQVTQTEAEAVVRSRKRAANVQGNSTPISQDPRMGGSRRRGRRGGKQRRLDVQSQNKEPEKKKSWWQKLLS